MSNFANSKAVAWSNHLAQAGVIIAMLSVFPVSVLSFFHVV